MASAKTKRNWEDMKHRDVVAAIRILSKAVRELSKRLRRLEASQPTDHLRR